MAQVPCYMVSLSQPRESEPPACSRRVPQVPPGPRVLGLGAMCLVRGPLRRPGVAGVPGAGAPTAALVAERRLARRQAYALEILARRVRRGPAKKQLRLLKERIRRYNGQMSTWCKTLSDWMKTCSIALRQLEDRVQRQEAWIKEVRRNGHVLRQIPPGWPCRICCPGTGIDGVPGVIRPDSLPGVPSCCGRGQGAEALSPLPAWHEMLHCHSHLPCMMERMARAWCLAPVRLHRAFRPPSFYWEKLDPQIVDALARTMGLQLGTVEAGCCL